MKVTLRALLTEGADRLFKAGIAEYELDARYLLFDCFRIDMVHYLLDQNQELLENEETARSIAAFCSMVEKRGARIPLQQITGSREFMGLEFCVDEHVLIPRQDTETLVEEVLKDYRGQDPRILDLCTGSGCIAVSLAVLGGFSHVTGSDISKEALKIAKSNGQRLAGGQVEFVCSDLFGAWEGSVASQEILEHKFDVIVSNPPYIPTGVLSSLEPEVRDHEPVLALDGKEDGLYFYKRIVKESRRFLAPGGALYLEIGWDQKEAVSSLLQEAGFGNICAIKDTPGLDRVVRGDLK